MRVSPAEKQLLKAVAVLEGSNKFQPVQRVQDLTFASFWLRKAITQGVCKTMDEFYDEVKRSVG
jgi:hypothetical protein